MKLHPYSFLAVVFAVALALAMTTHAQQDASEAPVPPSPAEAVSKAIAPEPEEGAPSADPGADPSTVLPDAGEALLTRAPTHQWSSCFASILCPSGPLLECMNNTGNDCASGTDWVFCNGVEYTCAQCVATQQIWCSYF